MSDPRFAILGDIHGNGPALTAVMEDARGRGVTAWLCVGDIVGYNAEPSECVDRIREVAQATVCGNHDHYCAHESSLEDFHPLAASVVAWTRRQLSEEQVDYLRGLSLVRMVAGFTLVHSTLDMPDKWGYVFDALEAEANFNCQTTSVCFYGHTHVPVVFERDQRTRRTGYRVLKLEAGRKYFVNAGSVGQPRDGDPRAAYVVYDLKSRVVELRRVAYDVAKAQERIRAAGLPERLAQRLILGK